MEAFWTKVSDREWVNKVPVHPIGMPDIIIPVGECRVYESQVDNFEVVE